MGRVCSMESKATLPVLVRRAGTRVAKTKFRRSWEGKDRGTFGKKAPGLHTSLRNPPRVQSCHPTPQKNNNRNIAASTSKIRSSTGYLTYLYLSGPYNTAKKGPTTASTRNFFLPDQPTSQHVVQQCIPDLRQAYYKVNTYIHQIYLSSSTRTVHLVPPELSQAPLANLFSLGPTS